MCPGDYAGATGTTLAEMESSSSNHLGLGSSTESRTTPQQLQTQPRAAADCWSVVSETEAGPKRNQKFWRYGSNTNSKSSKDSREETYSLLPQPQPVPHGSQTNIPALVATSGDGTTTFLSVPYTRISSNGGSSGPGNSSNEDLATGNKSEAADHLC